MKIWSERSCKSLSIVPFVSLFTNCYTWYLYGLFKHDVLLIYPNFLGIFAGLGSALLYQYISITYDKKSAKSNATIFLLSYIIVFLVSYLFHKTGGESIGLVGCIM